MRLVSKIRHRHSSLIEAIGDVLAHLPPSPHSVLLAAAFNRVLGRNIEPELLLPLQGKTLCIQVSDARLTFFFGADRTGFVARRLSHTPQITITASARDFVRLALREEDPDTLFFARRLRMEGDTELGLLLKNILDSVDPPRLFILRLLPDAGWAKITARLLP